MFVCIGVLTGVQKAFRCESCATRRLATVVVHRRDALPLELLSLHDGTSVFASMCKCVCMCMSVDACVVWIYKTSTCADDEYEEETAEAEGEPSE